MRIEPTRLDKAAAKFEAGADLAGTVNKVVVRGWNPGRNEAPGQNKAPGEPATGLATGKRQHGNLLGRGHGPQPTPPTPAPPPRTSRASWEAPDLA